MSNFNKSLRYVNEDTPNFKTFSKNWYMSWVIDNNWLIHESPGLKPDWLEKINSFSIKNSYSLLNINCSKIVSQIGVKMRVDIF